MATYTELQQQIEKLRLQAEEVRQKELASVIDEIKLKIEAYGLTAADLGLSTAPRRGRPARKAPLPPKYRNPKTGETWSGRGKPPKWIAGKNRTRFEIE